MKLISSIGKVFFRRWMQKNVEQTLVEQTLNIVLSPLEVDPWTYFAGLTIMFLLNLNCYSAKDTGMPEILINVAISSFIWHFSYLIALAFVICVGGPKIAVIYVAVVLAVILKILAQTN